MGDALSIYYLNIELSECIQFGSALEDYLEFTWVAYAAACLLQYYTYIASIEIVLIWFHISFKMLVLRDNTFVAGPYYLLGYFLQL